MGIEVNGTTLETTDSGYLVDIESWNDDVARAMADNESLSLTDLHWDVIRYLRDEYFNNNQSQPNTRTIVKSMAEKWGRDVDQSELYDLFPGDPSKQAGRVAGLPESRRKGGY
jgi:tRNA 2-thiouridine synthesizing protein E